MLFVHISDTSTLLKDIVNFGSWDVLALYTTVPLELMIGLMSMSPMLDPRFPDSWVWMHSSTGIYSAASAYAWLIESQSGSLGGGKLEMDLENQGCEEDSCVHLACYALFHSI